MTRHQVKIANAALTERVKPYPAYKESGVEWLGEIPAHWEVKRADSLLRYEKIQVEPSRISAHSVFHYSIPSIQETGDGVFESPSEIDSAKLRIFGQRLLISKLNPRKGVVVIANEKESPTICSTEFVPLDVGSCNMQWAYFLLASESTRQRLSAVVRSATRSHQRAEVDDVLKMWHMVPPPSEQTVIAHFLRRETAKIDALVAKQERLIELLREKRTALITWAVTNGLDPDVRMKESGVHWVGRIPVHWKTARVWQVCNATSGGTPSRDEPSYWDGAIPWVSPKDMKRRLLDDAEERITERGRRDAGLILIQPPAVLIVVRGMILAHSFPVALATAPLTINQDMKALHTSKGIEPLFFSWLLEGVSAGVLTTALEQAAHGTRAVRMDQWRLLLLPFPSVEEQRSIAAFLDRETAKIDALVAKIHSAIAHLKELRTALISAAVTGKIDVRDDAGSKPRTAP